MVGIEEILALEHLEKDIFRGAVPSHRTSTDVRRAGCRAVVGFCRE